VPPDPEKYFRIAIDGIAGKRFEGSNQGSSSLSIILTNVRNIRV
jgi:hypothetical protein